MPAAAMGNHIEQLVNALVEAFATAEMEQLVYYALNEPLPTIATGDTFRDQIYNLVLWAQRNHHLPILLAAAVAARPKNTVLRDLVATFHSERRQLVASAQPEESKDIVTDDRTNERLDRIVSELGLMRGEVQEIKGRLMRVEAQIERNHALPLNWNYVVVALIAALLIGIATYWLGMTQ